jgi:DNA-binding NarL/FixJ family response regulator
LAGQRQAADATVDVATGRAVAIDSAIDDGAGRDGRAGVVIRVVLVDDQAMVRQGLRMILEAEPSLAVVGEAGDGREALDLLPRARPDVVLMDVRMPRMDGIEACARIREHVTDDTPHVLMLTTFDLEDYVYAALRAGASGFLLKDAPAEQLVMAIEVVARGDALLAPQVTRLLIEEVARRPTPEPVPGLDRLTERELEVLRLMARGMSNGEIAAALYLGEATIKTHVGRVLTKLNARDRVQAVVAAYESGLVAPGTADR